MKYTTDTIIQAPEKFNFRLTIGSSWGQLAPFSFGDDGERLSRIYKLNKDTIINMDISKTDDGVIQIAVYSYDRISEEDLEDIRKIVSRCLRIDEDFSDFYSLIEDYPEYKWISEIGAGRSIRSPTVFEDVIKTISSTNCSWGLTKAISKRLCEELGDGFNGSNTFPSPLQIAESSESFIRNSVKAGYRSPYLLEFSEMVVEGRLNPESLMNSRLESHELRNEILKIKGVGDYAANTILGLLGRYDYLALDIWTRKRFRELNPNVKDPTDQVIQEYYSEFGKWSGVMFTLDLTKDFIMERLDYS